MKKLFLSMILMALPLVVSAYDCQVDGIYYNLIPQGNAAEVTCQKYENYSYFSDYSGSVTIPEKFTYNGVEYSVTSIGDYAFADCSGLTSVTIPNSVTSIESSAFLGCSGLTTVTIPNSVTNIGNFAFSGCSGLTSVTIPNSVTTIGGGAFGGCSGLTSVTIPNSVTKIESNAFSGCSGLTSVTIPNLVTSIGNFAFYGCSGLTSVTIPNSVTSIEEFAFSRCGLTIVNIPNSVTNIEGHAFEYCSDLISVTIPNSVTRIGNCAFEGCSSLTSITFPNSLTSIGNSAFARCSGLISVTIPNSVTSIGITVFSHCISLTSVIIPNSVTSIGKGAFANCYKLDKFYYYASMIPSTNSSAFENSGIQYATLYVWADMVKAFKTVAPWSEFGTIKSLEESGINPNPDPSDSQCATPTISYAEKRLTFSCETEGVEYHYTITDSDIKSDVSSSIDLSATYEISVYAMKEGLGNSDVATATLVWTDAIFTETTPETPTSAKAVQESIPVLISAKGGNISVKCEADGQEVNVYTIDGLSLGSATVKNGEALISTSIPSGDIAVVKVGGRSVKVIMR